MSHLTMSEIAGNTTSTTKYEYNGANELLKKIAPDGQATEYQYDLNGNRIAKIGPSYTTNYEYDFENRLTKIDEHNGKSIDYQYNGDGVRLSKTVNNPNLTKDVFKYVNDIANPLEQVLAIYDEQDKLQANYVYGIERISVQDMDITTGKVQDPLYYLYDGLGSVTQLTDATGKVADKYMFDEFGNDQPGGKQSPNASKVQHNVFGYAGEQWDAETGLQYLRARYYDPEIGRFINEDSYAGDISNPISQNRYAYVWNNPVNYRDPSGNWSENVHYDYTKEWAKEAGFSEEDAERIAQADKDVDNPWYDKSFLPAPLGDQSWHFDRDPGEGDTRIDHLNESMETAKQKLHQNQWEYALNFLGAGLHALQDIYAHMDVGENNPYFADHMVFNKDVRYDDITYDVSQTNSCGWVKRDNEWENTRFIWTYIHTMDYLKEFLLYALADYYDRMYPFY